MHTNREICCFKNIFLILRAFLFLNVFLLISCSSIKTKKWTEEQIVNEKYKEQISLADAYLSSVNFQGTVLIGKKDKIIFAKGYGTSDKKDPENPQNTIFTTFEAGSITKQMTAAAIMQLVEKRKISVDDKLSRYFPDYKYGDDITVRMLLNMRSGLTDCINATYEFFPASVANKIFSNKSNNHTFEEDIVVKYLYEAPLFTTPNSTFFYCNTDYYLLGKIVEQVSGLSYNEYMSRNILEKCGMSSSNFQFQNTTAKGYDFNGHYCSIPSVLSMGCGDVNTNVLDLFRWNNMLAEGKVVSKKSFKEMTDTVSYGYGLYRFQNTILHGGNTNVFNSYNSYNLDNKYSVIVLVNRPIYETNAVVIAEKLKNYFEFSSIIRKK